MYWPCPTPPLMLGGCSMPPVLDSRSTIGMSQTIPGQDGVLGLLWSVSLYVLNYSPCSMKGRSDNLGNKTIMTVR